MLHVLLLILGFVLLIKGADIFVDGASATARNFKLSKMLIGLTIVAFGTSAPEFAVSIKSLMAGSGDMLLGNVIGSNILNILLILGVSAVIRDLKVKSSTVKKELPMLILLSLGFATVVLDKLFGGGANGFSRQDGLILVLFFMVFVYYLFSMMRNKTEDETEDEEPTLKLGQAILLVIAGIAGIVIGSNLVVDGAIGIAKAIGVGERMIGLTIVALGTSLPELVTSVMATKKGELDIAIGNVVGSNIFNMGIVAGLPVAVLGGVERISFSYVDLAVMVIAAGLLFMITRKDQRINRREGVLMLVLFTVYYGYVIMGTHV